MPHPNSINPDTGKRYGFVDPKKDQAKQLREIQKQIATTRRMEAAARAREDLMAFTQFTSPDPEDPSDDTKSSYKAKRFHKSVAKTFTDFVNEKLCFADGRLCRQLIFCMPPRHGKTELTTRRLPAWFAGANPRKHIVIASYSDTKAEEFGGDIRTIIKSPSFRQVYPNYTFARGSTSKSSMQGELGGRIISVGRGGALTGSGAHLAIGDDLFKDHEEARSQAIRDQAWNWFTKVFMTRRMGAKLVVLTMNRWHSDDIIGRITDPENQHYNAEEAANWMIIRIPAIAEEDDPPESRVGREPGEALWEEEYGVDFLNSQMRLDPLGFATQYQQRPTVADGTLFRRENVRYYDKLPEDLRFYSASDHAVGTKQRNDPSCLGKIGIDRQDNIYVLPPDWRRMTTDVAVEAMLVMASGSQAPLLWWAERGHISGSIGPFLRKRVQETGVYINLVEVTPKADKEQRAQSIAARFAQGKVFFPREGLWVERAINELLAFPNGLHDDFVDMLAYIGLGLGQQFGKGKLPDNKPVSAPTGSVGWMKQMDRWNADKKRSLELGGF